MSLSLAQRIAVGGLFAGVLGHACAQSIFTCVDAKGRRLTSDRMIAECTDREQQELTPTGILKRKVGPTLTVEERAVEEEKQRQAIEERNRQLEEKKRDRALLARYPNKAVHDKERAMALAAIDETIVSAHKNTESLLGQRKRMELDLEFYHNDLAKAPPALRRQLDENQQHLDAQKRFVANQDAEKKRINTRFDEEQAKLKLMWAQSAPPATAAAAPASAPVKR